MDLEIQIKRFRSFSTETILQPRQYFVRYVSKSIQYVCGWFQKHYATLASGYTWTFEVEQHESPIIHAKFVYAKSAKSMTLIRGKEKHNFWKLLGKLNEYVHHSAMSIGQLICDERVSYEGA